MSVTTHDTYNDYFATEPFSLASESVDFYNQVLCSGRVAAINNQVVLQHGGTTVDTAAARNATNTLGTTSSDARSAPELSYPTAEHRG